MGIENERKKCFLMENGWKKCELLCDIFRSVTLTQADRREKQLEEKIN